MKKSCKGAKFGEEKGTTPTVNGNAIARGMLEVIKVVENEALGIAGGSLQLQLLATLHRQVSAQAAASADLLQSTIGQYLELSVG